MLAFVFLPIALAASSFAVPTARQAGSCAGLGSQALWSAYNFTLAAFNASSSTAIPLIFQREGSNNSISAIGVLSTAAEYSHDVFPNFSLVNGTLIPNQDFQSAVDMPVTAGEALTFEYTQSALQQYLPPASPDYCAVLANDDGYGNAVLYASGDASSFYTCTDEWKYNSIIYKPVSENGGLYDYSSCVPVTIKLQ